MLRGSQVLTRQRPIRLATCTKRIISTAEVIVPKKQSKAPQMRTSPANVAEVPGVRSRAVFIRVWDGIGSMADLFAIVAQIEKHFGRIADFTAPRDSDVKGTYVGYIHATFARSEDVAAIPREGKVIQVPDPNVDATLLGGVSIRDIQEYLDAGSRESYLHEGAARRAAKREIPPFPKEVKVIDVKVEHADVSKRVTTQNSHSIRQTAYRSPHARRTRELAEEIVTFGRSYSGIEDASKDSAAPLEQLVARWSGMLPAKNRRDLSVSSKQDAVESGSGSHADDVEMSQQGGAERVLGGTLNPSNISSSSSHLFSESSHIAASTSEPLTTSTPIHTHARESTPASQPPPSDTPLSTAPHENAGTSTPRQKSKPALAPKQPTLSKRERMLLAVRQAGAAEVSSRKERGERDSTDVWRDYDGADDREHPEVGMKGSGAEGSRVGEPLPEGYGDLWEFSRPENTRNAESEGSEGEKQSPQETETMEEATSWWRKMTRFRK
ncbi:hypothetical protein BU17DRAFT_85736 [Hysterangium stoloniferum]|nr:hypothetical protein BU17DRAFT_85736 [Hysterangium stoloniferum]